jgi:preprotein translocase subunit SecF
MLQIFVDPHYDFIGRRRWGYLLSVAFVLTGLVSLTLKGGLRYDVDFAGGTLIQVRFEAPASPERVRAGVTRLGLGDAVIQEYGDPREFIIRFALTETQAEALRERVQQAFVVDPGLGAIDIRRIEFVGPQVGRDLQLQAIYAVLAGLAGIVLYIALRFDLKSGVAAFVAVIHDVLVSVGALSLTNREFSLPVLAALLTIIGYSVNDKIVAYDRVRENQKKGTIRSQTFAQQINAALNQTLARTVLTGSCVLLVTLLLLFFGGKVLEDFAFALFVGVVTGTYSSVFVATPLMVDWEAWARPDRPGRQKPVKTAARR